MDQKNKSISEFPLNFIKISSQKFVDEIMRSGPDTMETNLQKQLITQLLQNAIAGHKRRKPIVDALLRCISSEDLEMQEKQSDIRYLDQNVIIFQQNSTQDTFIEYDFNQIPQLRVKFDQNDEPSKNAER